jgi:hypothetical protein
MLFSPQILFFFAKFQNRSINPSGRNVTPGEREKEREREKNAVIRGLPKFAPLAHANRSDQKPLLQVQRRFASLPAQNNETFGPSAVLVDLPSSLRSVLT